jgi:hypothetical protein
LLVCHGADNEMKLSPVLGGDLQADSKEAGCCLRCCMLSTRDGFSFASLVWLLTASIARTNTEPEAVATGSRFGSANLGSQNDPVATASGSVFFDPPWRSMLDSFIRIRQADNKMKLGLY